MYSKDYAEYIITAQLSDEYQDPALKILALVPENGFLEFNIQEISIQTGIDQETITQTLVVMQNHKVPLCEQIHSSYLFDYPEKGIEYVKHFRRAISNWGMLEDEFV